MYALDLTLYIVAAVAFFLALVRFEPRINWLALGLLALSMPVLIAYARS